MRRKWVIAFLISSMAVSSVFALNSIAAENAVLHVMGYSKIAHLPGRQIKLLVWNIQKTDNDHFVTEFKKISSEYDLILLQEGLFSFEHVNPYLQSKWHEIVVAKSFMLPFSQRKAFTGVATFAKAHSTKNQFIKTQVTEPILKTPKMTLITHYKLLGHRHQLMVVNIHAVNFVMSSDYKKELERLYEVMKVHQGPIIFAGDFNTWSEKRLKILRHYVAKLSLKEVEIPHKYRKTDYQLVLDHVFVRGAKTVAVHDLSVMQGSDHEPLSIVLNFTS